MPPIPGPHSKHLATTPERPPTAPRPWLAEATPQRHSREIRYASQTRLPMYSYPTSTIPETHSLARARETWSHYYMVKDAEMLAYLTDFPIENWILDFDEAKRACEALDDRQRLRREGEQLFDERGWGVWKWATQGADVLVDEHEDSAAAAAVEQLSPGTEAEEWDDDFYQDEDEDEDEDEDSLEVRREPAPGTFLGPYLVRNEEVHEAFKASQVNFPQPQEVESLRSSFGLKRPFEESAAAALVAAAEQADEEDEGEYDDEDEDEVENEGDGNDNDTEMPSAYKRPRLG